MLGAGRGRRAGLTPGGAVSRAHTGQKCQAPGAKLHRPTLHGGHHPRAQGAARLWAAARERRATLTLCRGPPGGSGTAASWLRPRTRPAPETSGSCQRDLPAPAWDSGVRGPVRGECRPPRLTHRSCAVLTRRVPQTTRRGRGYNYCPCFPDEETGAGRLGSMARVTQGQWPRWALRPLVEASAARVGDGGGARKEGSWRPLHVPATPRRPHELRESGLPCPSYS